MKTRIIVIVAIILSLNFGANIPTQAIQRFEQHQTFSLKHAFELNAQRQQLVKIVKYIQTRQHKTPYVFSGSTIHGWDCSGLVRYAYSRLGIELPHSADKQGHLCRRVNKPRIGDIVVFAYKGQTDFYHAALYVGDRQIVNANREYNTTIVEPIKNFRHSEVRFIRIIEQ